MKKIPKIYIYLISAIIALLIIPEVILRNVPNDILAKLGDLTSLGGLFSPFISAMIFIGVSSMAVGILIVYAVRKFYRGSAR